MSSNPSFSFLPNINVIQHVLTLVNYELIIVRYGEIALKAKETRKRFENTLVSNIKNALDASNLPNKVTKEYGRIYVHTNEIKKGTEVLQKIFGIYSVSPALKTSSDMKSISKLSIDIANENLNKEKSFAIRTTRTGEHDYSSQDVSIKIGNDIVKSTKAKVNLTKPDFELFIEIRNDKSFLFTEKIRCVGGMPLGSQGTVLSLVEGPKDVLAAWYLMRRGCKVSFLSTDNTLKKTLKFFSDRWFVKPDIFLTNSNDLPDEINQISSKNKVNAVVTGHTLFNKSKNMIIDIKKLKEQTNLTILNPLVSMDETEIINKCKQIGLSV
jgi:tRNA uracil 4-sulfurtransferase